MSSNLLQQESDDVGILSLSITDGQIFRNPFNGYDAELSFEISEMIFLEVHSSHNEDNQEFSEIYYNSEIGIVAFRGLSDELWVHSHYE